MSDQLSAETIQFLQPVVLYEKLSTPRLLTGFYLENRLFEMQVYLMLLHRSGLALPVSFQDWQHQARKLEFTDLPRLYKLCGDDILIQLMFLLKTQWHLMVKEIHKRFDEKDVGLAVLMEQWQKVEKCWIETRRLKIDREDTKQEGLLKGLTILNTVKANSLDDEEHQAFLKLPVPQLPVEMDNFELTAWQSLCQEMWSPSLRAAFSNVVPLLRGDMESSRGAVDNFLHEHGRKFKRRRNIIQGKEEFPKDGPESWRADWDFSKTAGEQRRQEIANQTHSSDMANHKPDISSQMFGVLRLAKKNGAQKR